MASNSSIVWQCRVGLRESIFSKKWPPARGYGGWPCFFLLYRLLCAPVKLSPYLLDSGAGTNFKSLCLNESSGAVADFKGAELDPLLFIIFIIEIVHAMQPSLSLVESCR